MRDQQQPSVVLHQRYNLPGFYGVLLSEENKGQIPESRQEGTQGGRVFYEILEDPSAEGIKKFILDQSDNSFYGLINLDCKLNVKDMM